MLHKIKVDVGYRIENDETGAITYFGEYARLGCNEGVIYKDYEAFKSGKGVCYIPEFGFDCNEDGIAFDAPREGKDNFDIYQSENGYTRADYLALCSECKNPEQAAEDLFSASEWQHPETLVDEGYLDDMEEQND